jgi:hypothetical protein
MDIDEWTPQVLTKGLPPLPERLEPCQRVPVALWRGERHGAVLFVRLRSDGDTEFDCAIAERTQDGSWKEANSWGGGAPADIPLVRNKKGWAGEQVLWKGMLSDEDVRAVSGVAAVAIAAIEVEQGDRGWTFPIDSPCGAFVVVLETLGPATLRAVGSNGEVIGQLFRTEHGPGPA